MGYREQISDQAKINIIINVFSIFKIRIFTIALALHFQYDVLQLMSCTLFFTQIVIKAGMKEFRFYPDFPFFWSLPIPDRPFFWHHWKGLDESFHLVPSRGLYVL